MNAAALYRLMTWLSPAYPVGSYAYSHGVETAVTDGAVTDRISLVSWVGACLRWGAGRGDAILFRRAFAAFARGDEAAAEEVRALGIALAPTAELRLQTEQQGRAFLDITREAWPCAPVAQLVDSGRPAPFPVAVAAACAGHGIGVEDGLTAYLTEMSANLVSAGLRLIPLGQQDGQRAIAALEGCIAGVAAASAGLDLDDIASATPAVDLASMQHETQYTRLFRS